MSSQALILGAGVTGLAAGTASGLPVFEATDVPGGICSSYYMRPGDSARLPVPPPDEEVYRLEIGGGHWIFGGDSAVLRFIQSLAPARRYTRSSAVYFPDGQRLVPYPIQNNLAALPSETREQAVQEIVELSQKKHSVATMADWLRASLGETLCGLFFFPFHDLYTAGLYTSIAAQDAYKSPIDLSLVIKGAFNEAPAAGYNVTFMYPEEGLNALAQRMAAQANVKYGKRVAGIDPDLRVVRFDDGSVVNYDLLLSTLPLNRMIGLTGLRVDSAADPATSVLVANIGAHRGDRCPDAHWLYIPRSEAGFHRVGFYSNVDRSFLPASHRERNDRVAIYVEKAYQDGKALSAADSANTCRAIVRELQSWGFIGEVEVVDPTWIDVAYTWAWPGSTWRGKALKMLEEHGILQVGRYGRWVFQGIADSIRDGLVAGAAFRVGAGKRLRVTTSDAGA